MKHGEAFMRYVRCTDEIGSVDRAAVNAVEADKANAYQRVLRKYSAVFESLPKGLPQIGGCNITMACSQMQGQKPDLPTGSRSWRKRKVCIA